ncbi:MAG TPA: lamin tail domain-containing protein [Daejeonella sp.]
MKQILLLLGIFVCGILHAQVSDDFSDGNFTVNPEWSGNNSNTDFIISDNKLRSNSSTANSSFFISTASTLATGTQWEIWVNLQLSTSGANYTDIYVISDKEDLKAASINGYFIRIGNTDDEISLYKRSGAINTSIKIIDGINGAVGSSNNTVKVKLKRDINGLFTLEREIVSAGSSYLTEGSITDLTHVTSTHFGVFVQQSTASFFFKHFFDNIKVEPILLDIMPPDLVSVSAIDSNTLEITFNEAMDSLTVKTASNFSINPNVFVTGVSTTVDPARFVLKLAGGLASGTYNLHVSAVKDRNGNLMEDSKAFTYVKPYLPKPGDIVINEIFADPSPPISLPSAEFVELRNNSDQSISLKNWKFSDSGSSSTLGEISIDPGGFIILCARTDTSDFQPFGKTIGLSPWPSLNNAGDLLKLISTGEVIDSVNYADTWYRSAAKKTGGWTLERKDPKSTCEGIFNWLPSDDTAGGTPGKENSIYLSETDLLPLYADSLKQLSDTTIRVFFNKSLSNKALIAENFTLTPPAGITGKITADEELKRLTIYYNEKFKPGTEYNLTISNVTDCSGIQLSRDQSTLKFKTTNLPDPIPERPDSALIIITEIFADPSPEVLLPLVEFIEIYNPSKDTVELDKWTLSDPGTETIFPKQKILPQEYIILCPAADTLTYKKYGKTIGLSPWPSLNNSSDQISLRSHKNRLADSVSYSDTWYHNQSKKTGGWSLERIDLKSICNDFLNWTASVDTVGGTPGKRNSAGLNRTALKADSVQIVSDTTMKIYFNRPVYEASLLIDNFKLSSGPLVKTLTFGREAREASLTWPSKLDPGSDYELMISNIMDCSGNKLIDKQLIKFKTAPLPIVKIDTGRVIITEIFADPSPEIGLPLTEYIEIYNPGLGTIDLSKWVLSDVNTKSLIPSKAIGAREYVILCPVADTLSFKQYGNVIGLNPWPALGNSSDRLTIKSFRQRLVDSVDYSDKWYKSRMKKNGGWSLERINLSNSSCSGFYSWVASQDDSGGTPGRANSRQINGNEALIRIDWIKHTSDSTIVIKLNTIPDTSYLTPTFFSVNNGMGYAKTLIVSDDYEQVTLGFASKFKEGITYLLSADSLFNCSGLRSKAQEAQASFTIPAEPDLDFPIIINEIFAAPSPSVDLPETEFIELHNLTANTVSLAGLIYGDERNQYKFTSGRIDPGGYLILCPEKDTLNFVKLGKVHGLNIWPALNNDSDVLFLKNNKGRELQKVAYAKSWYKDTGKKAGGYSLEMINPASVCAGIQNWQASKDASGGTPGKINSVYLISEPESLKLQHASMADSIHLLLTFNHAVDSLSALDPGNYAINNGVGAPASITPIAPYFNTILLRLKAPPAKGHTYALEVKGLRNCTGSEISKDFDRAEFTLTKPILKSDILINEVLFNPRPGGADFVEVYNNTKHDLDLQELFIATMLKDSISSVKKISTTQSLIAPGQHLVFTADPENIAEEYSIGASAHILKIAPMPAFNDNNGTVLLLSGSNIIDRFNYSEKMHFQLLKKFEGISLERSRFDLDANIPGNFRSATAASGYATPGYKNSQFSSFQPGTEEFTLSSKTFSPDSDGFEDLMEVSYNMTVPGMVATVKILNDKGLLIKSLLKNSTLNKQGILTWDGLDEQNNLSGPGIYVIYAEIFDASGNVERFRKAFALAIKL